MRRTIVNTRVGLGTPNRYELACPKCGTINMTPDAGKTGHLTVDGTPWYYFDCACGERYKAIEVPMRLGPLMRTTEALSIIFGGAS